MLYDTVNKVENLLIRFDSFVLSDLLLIVRPLVAFRRYLPLVLKYLLQMHRKNLNGVILLGLNMHDLQGQ
jgi:hypothetical protein